MRSLYLTVTVLSSGIQKTQKLKPLFSFGKEVQSESMKYSGKIFISGISYLMYIEPRV